MNSLYTTELVARDPSVEVYLNEGKKAGFRMGRAMKY